MTARTLSPHSSKLKQVPNFAKQQFYYLTKVNKHPRPWHLPLVCAVAISLPVFIGASLEQLPAGLIASLGSMLILNLPYTGAFTYRLSCLLACGFGFVACFSLGLLAQIAPIVSLPLVGFACFWLMWLCSYFRLPPPAGTFMVMAMAIGIFLPTSIQAIPHFVGLLALGCVFSGMIGSAYCVVWLFHRLRRPRLPPLPLKQVVKLLVQSGFSAVVVSLSLAIALWLGMDRPYWVLVSCYILMQTISLEDMWVKQLHRIAGTILGMGVAWVLLSVVHTGFGVAFAIFGLMFLIETLVVRHYGLAMMFITPLTIIVTEFSAASAITDAMQQHIIITRFLDTVLGCVLGYLGGIIYHLKWTQRQMTWLQARIYHIWKKRFSHFPVTS